jgi:hypothetical protein
MPVLLEFRRIRVRSLDCDFNEVTWELEDTSEDVLDYTIQVQRSESGSGPWSNLDVPFSDSYRFIDNTIHTGHRWRKYFYQLLVKHVPSGDCQTFGPVSKDPDPDLIALELRRHNVLLFREFAGRRCWVLPVRTFGQRCSCWNPNTRQANRSGCKTCWGTTYVRGYMHPVESWMQIDPSPKSEQNTNVGAQQQSNTTMRMPWYPPLKPRDLVIEGENRRWRVTTVTQTEKGRAGIHQEVGLHEIPPRDLEFSIPLELGIPLRDLWLSPSRNYTNPTTLENFMEEKLPRVFELFPTTKRNS